jgi:hypothetical protein
MAKAPRPKKCKPFIRYGGWEFSFESVEEMNRLGELCRQLFCLLREYGDEDVARALAIARVTAGLANSRGKPRSNEAADLPRFEKMFQLITEAKNRGDVLSPNRAAEKVAERECLTSDVHDNYDAMVERLRKNYHDFLLRYVPPLCPDSIFSGLTADPATGSSDFDLSWISDAFKMTPCPACGRPGVYTGRPPWKPRGQK